MSSIVRFVARQKYRFDQGQGFLSMVNLVLISVAASGKIESMVGINGAAIVAIMVPSVLVGVWVFGLVLDKAGFPKLYQDEANDRNGMLNEIKQKVNT